jgi:hypothetical protein
MSTFTVTGYKTPGQTFTVTNATAPAVTDSLILNGIKQTVADWTKCGVIKFVGTVSTTHTYYLMATPEIVGQQAG